MNKYEALKEVFEIDGVENRLQDYNNNAMKKVPFDILLNLMSKNSYNLAKDLGIASVTTSKLLSRVFPDKPKSSGKVCSYLFHKYGYKYCGHCSEVKPLEEFNSNKSQKTGLNAYCKVCHNATNAATQAARTATYRASKIDRTPKWVDQDKLKEMYKKCPKGMHVDHIIPLNGQLVSGLHVPENLQYLTPESNTSKYSKYTIE